MKKFLLITVILLLQINLYADYLEVRRNVGIKKDSISNSEVIYNATAGELFFLLDNAKQSNGYYHIQIDAGKDGWVYRTMVRLHKGPLPGLEKDDPAPSSVYGIGQIPVDYYEGIESLNGENLKKQLHLIIRNHKVFSYNDAWDILSETDKDPYNSDNIILLYNKRSQDATQRDRGTRYDYTANGYTLNDSWNREHVWPKSHGFPNPKDTAYTDLHHLRPADRSTNSARNTRSFDKCLNIYFDNAKTVETECYTSSTKWAWEPPDEVKGDVARMIFYMAVRYEGPAYDLEILDQVVPKGIKEPTIGKLSTLLRWHKNDPVDNWERKRNHIIFEKYQGNRNPFIDHPDWVNRIWN